MRRRTIIDVAMFAVEALTAESFNVDGCHCDEVLQLIEQGKIDTTPLITHRFPLSRIDEAYNIFENKEDGVIKIAIYNE